MHRTVAGTPTQQEPCDTRPTQTICRENTRITHTPQDPRHGKPEIASHRLEPGTLAPQRSGDAPTTQAPSRKCSRIVHTPLHPRRRNPKIVAHRAVVGTPAQREPKDARPVQAPSRKYLRIPNVPQDLPHGKPECGPTAQPDVRQQGPAPSTLFHGAISRSSRPHSSRRRSARHRLRPVQADHPARTADRSRIHVLREARG